MADISKIKLPSGLTYDLKDPEARDDISILNTWPYQKTLDTRTYTGVIATTNDNRGGGFFYMKVRGNTWNSRFRIKVRVRVTVPGQELYSLDSIFEAWGFQNGVLGYSATNHILSTSYRPIYYHSVFLTNSAGYNSDCGHWIGINLYASTNPTNTSYKRTVIVDLLEYENCTVAMQDSLITPDNIPERATHTNYYTSTNTSYVNYDACSQGLKQSGDNNTTSISNLYHTYGNYIADSIIYRYQMVFQIDENKITPLNNDNNIIGTTKTMLTDAEFQIFGRIYYFYSTATVNANAAFSGGNAYYSFNTVDLRYTFNCGTTLTGHKPFYLVVIPTSTPGMCKIANSTPWAQELPETADGYYYILLGRTYNSYQMSLYPCHPVYYHNGTTIQELLPQNALATTSVAGLMSAADKIKLDNSSSAESITSGILPVEHGGTGQTSLVNAANSLINSLTPSDTNPFDNDWYVSQYANGGASTTTFHRRPIKYLWEYIKGKIETILGLNETNYSGSAAKVNNHTVESDVPANAVFTDTTYGVATSSSNGLMSITDKVKLDAITTVPIASGTSITEGTDGLIVTFTQ